MGLSKLALWLSSSCALIAAFPLESRQVQVSNSASSLTLLYQNNLNASDDVNHVGAILLDPTTQAQASGGCGALGESLISETTLKNYTSDFVESLDYLAFANYVKPGQSYFIENGVVTVGHDNQLLFASSAPWGVNSLPVLCTQTQGNASQPQNSTATASNQVVVEAGGNTYVGYRNKKSFRFLGFPFADPPVRFHYSNVYSKTGQTINATAYGSECLQQGGGSENCLFANIQTPYIPAAGSKANLRPVLFWIYGGGFTGGSSSDPLSDGGNLASREDIVVISINYRLSTLGFLAIPGTNVTGNYGISDQVTGLEWAIANIEKFGGDPNRITIMGESAGAGSVRTLLGSPPAIGKFQGAFAMSNLGGGVDLGLDGNYGTTYSSYLTLNESYTLAGQQIFNASNCTSSSLEEEIACLSTYNATALVYENVVARYVVQDGVFVNTPDLDVINRNGSAAYVPIVFGTSSNDGASFSTFPKTPVANETEGLMVGLSINESYANAIINSGLFPYYDTGNVTLDSFNVTQRVATDNTFRCIDEATVYAGAVSGAFPATYYYNIDRTIGGYDPNNLGASGLSSGPVEPGYPLGDPELPYFRLHGADMAFLLANLINYRDANDLYAEQVISGYVAAFVRSHSPNPSIDYLKVRGYQTVLQAVQETGPWPQVSGSGGNQIKYLDYPSYTGEFPDMPQCTWLNYTISYYLDGGM